MIVDLKQVNKEIATADFQIIESGTVIGTMHVEGKFCAREAILSSQIFGMEYVLQPGVDSEKNMEKMFRPYRIFANNLEVGMIYQTEIKTGLFTTMPYQQIIFNGEIYKIYSVALGKEGGKSSVYRGDEQIALIETDAIIYDDLHDFHIYAIDEESTIIALLISYYKYVHACFNSRTKVINSVEKTYTVTTNKKLREKYNPDFKKQILMSES